MGRSYNFCAGKYSLREGLQERIARERSIAPHISYVQAIQNVVDQVQGEQEALHDKVKKQVTGTGLPTSKYIDSAKSFLSKVKQLISHATGTYNRIYNVSPEDTVTDYISIIPTNLISHLKEEAFANATTLVTALKEGGIKEELATIIGHSFFKFKKQYLSKNIGEKINPDGLYTIQMPYQLLTTDTNKRYGKPILSDNVLLAMSIAMLHTLEEYKEPTSYSIVEALRTLNIDILDENVAAPFTDKALAAYSKLEVPTSKLISSLANNIANILGMQPASSKDTEDAAAIALRNKRIFSNLKEQLGEIALLTLDTPVSDLANKAEQKENVPLVLNTLFINGFDAFPKLSGLSKADKAIIKKIRKLYEQYKKNVRNYYNPKNTLKYRQQAENYAKGNVAMIHQLAKQLRYYEDTLLFTININGISQVNFYPDPSQPIYTEGFLNKNRQLKENDVIQTIPDTFGLEKAPHKTFLTKPSKQKVKFSKKGINDVPEFAAKIGDSLQKQQWSLNKSASHAFALFEDEAFTRILLGIKENHPDWDLNYQQKIEASNAPKLHTIKALKKLREMGALSNVFYFAYSLHKSLRLNMQGLVNPQDNKITRYMFKPFTSHKYDNANYHLFKEAIVHLFTEKNDKHPYEYVESTYSRILAAEIPLTKNGKKSITLLDFVKELRAVENNESLQNNVSPTAYAKKTHNKLKRVITALLEGRVVVNGETLDAESGMALLQALTGLSHAVDFIEGNASSFTSDVAIEIDGLSNGVSIGLFQFMFGENFTQFMQYANMTGGFATKSEDNPMWKEGIYEDAENNKMDIPTKLGQIFAAKLHEAQIFDSLWDRFISHTKRDRTWLKDSIAEFNEEIFGELLKEKSAIRAFMKYPLMLFVYAAGIRSIARNAVKDNIIWERIVPKINGYQVEYNELSAKIEKATNAKQKKKWIKKREALLKEIYNFNAYLGYLSGSEEINFGLPTIIQQNALHKVDLSDKYAKLAESLGTALAPVFDSLFEESFPQNRERMTTVIDALGIIQHILEDQLEKKKQQWLKETNIQLLSEGLRILTKVPEDISEILLKDLVKELGLTFNIPELKAEPDTLFSYMLTEKEDSWTKAARPAMTAYYGNAKKTLTAANKNIGIKDASPAHIVVPTHMLDSLMLYKVLKENPAVLPLFDAIITAPEYAEAGAETYNDAYKTISLEMSVYADIIGDALRLMQEYTPEISEDTEEARKAYDDGLYEISQIVNSYYEKAFYNSRPEGTDLYVSRDLSDVQQDLQATQDFLQNRKAKVIQYFDKHGFTSRQLYMSSLNQGDRQTYPNRKEYVEHLKARRDENVKRVREIYAKNPKKLDEKIKAIHEQYQADLQRSLDGIQQALFQEADSEIFRSLPATSLQALSDKAESLQKTEVTQTSLNSIMEKLVSISAKYYPDTASFEQHKATLQKVSELIFSALDSVGNIPLEVFKIGDITQGIWDRANKKINLYISTSDQVKFPGTSPQVTYLHELLHAVFGYTIDKDPALRRRINKIYQRTLQRIQKAYAPGKEYEVLLQDPDNATDAERDLAKRQYNYIFNPNSAQNKYHEFVAYGLTHPALHKFLSGHTLDRKITDTTAESLLGKLVDIAVNILDKFTQLSKKIANPTDATELYLLFAHVVRQQHKSESVLHNLEHLVDRGVKLTNDVIRKAALESTKFVLKTAKLSSLHTILVVKGIADQYNVDLPNSKKLRDSLLDTAMSVLPNELVNSFKELNTNTLGKDLKQHNLYAKNQVDRAYQTLLAEKVEAVVDAWKSVKYTDLDMTIRTGLTRVLLQTELASLLEVGKQTLTEDSLTFKKMHTVFKNLDNVSYIQQQKTNILNTLQIPANASIVQAMNDLGRFMVTRKNTHPDFYSNARQISKAYLSDPTPAQVEALDKYITWHALEVMNQEYPKNIQDIKQLALNEFNHGNINGITNALLEHRKYVERVLRLNERYAINRLKGAVPSQTDALTSIETASIQDKARMKKKGYTADPIHIKGLFGTNKINNAIYISKNMPESRYVSGVFVMDNPTPEGISISKLVRNSEFLKDNPAHKHKYLRNIFDKLSKGINSEIRSNPYITIVATRNYYNKIEDYRVVLTQRAIDTLLQPNTEFHNVFSTMYAQQVRRENAGHMNRKTVNLLIKEQEELLPLRPTAFVNLLDPKYLPYYNKLPEATQQYIMSMATPNANNEMEFPVRKEILHKLAGYKGLNIRDLSILNKEGRESAKRIVSFVEEFFRTVFSRGTQLIVTTFPSVLTNNLISNIAVLSIRGIPLAYQFAKIYEGYMEYRDYAKASRELRHLTNKIQKFNLSKNSPEYRKALVLRDEILNNKVHPLKKMGLDTLIVEDVNMASPKDMLGILADRVLESSLGQQVIEHTPDTVKEAGKLLFLTEDSKVFMALKDIAQLTDFLARYVYVQYNVNELGRDLEESVMESVDIWINFDEVLPQSMEYLDTYGFTKFVKYKVRNQYAALQNLIKHPSRAIGALLLEDITDLPTSGSLGASFLDGDVMPLTLYQDELLDYTTNIPLLQTIDNGISMF